MSTLNVLELGAGCGIVGIALAHFFHANVARLILTDLPEASDILTHNLSLLPTKKSPTHLVLDWFAPLPPSVAATPWHLIFVADCTYNPDVVPALVQTLTAIAHQSSTSARDVLVCLAMKVRHESEMVFFDLMSSEGWVVREKMAVGLGVLGTGGEQEEIEIFVFGMK
jgi:predicted nicotinamide N-methyase